MSRRDPGRLSWSFVAVAAFLPACGGIFHRGPGSELAVPQGSALDHDIAAGYDKYARVLEPWGRWSPDPLYAMRWCPGEVEATQFVPYRSQGHWAPAASAGSSNGTEGTSPYWVNADATVWREVTMHHGWWVHLDGGAPASQWCWIPGAQPTAARVVWRAQDGYVGWAPEPPSTEGDEEVDVDNLDWTFSLLGTLFSDVVDILSSDGAAVADSATWPTRHDPARPGQPRRSGPSAQQVQTARTALSQYAAAHPTVTASASPFPSLALSSGGAAHGAIPETVASSEASPSAATKHSSWSTSVSSASSTEGLPPAMVLYEQLSRDPVLAEGGLAGGFLPVSPGIVYSSRGSPLALASSASHGVAAGSSGGSSSSSSHGKSSSSSHGGSSSSSSSTSSHKK
jgi:hypothetical protein